MWISGCWQKLQGCLVGEQAPWMPPPGPMDASSRHPLWTCGASKGPVDAADLSNSAHNCASRTMHTNLFNNSRCEWPYPWLHWWHCCHLWSTLWGIYSSSPALLHMIWGSLWSLDCPDSNRWTPEEDAPSSDHLTGGFPHQEQCVLSEPRNRRTTTAESPSLRVSGGSPRSGTLQPAFLEPLWAGNETGIRENPAVFPTFPLLRARGEKSGRNLTGRVRFQMRNTFVCTLRGARR